ncbi:MAG: DsbA family protein [Pseudomonadota bacterium]
MADAPARRVEVYWSLQSPYCYLLLDRLLWLDAQADVTVAIRPVLPGVLRLAETYRRRGAREQAYFDRDTARTAAFEGMSFAPPEPSPVAFVPGEGWVAEPDQPRIGRLYDLFVSACRAGRALTFLDHVMRLIWDGRTRGWDTGDHLERAVRAAGLEPAKLQAEAAADPERIADTLAANAQAMLEAGHHGVPLMVLDSEPFYGQDRFDQLLWRLGMSRS